MSSSLKFVSSWGQAVSYLTSLLILLAHYKLEAMSAQTVGKGTQELDKNWVL